LILSLDISTSCTGFCVFDNSGNLIENSAIILSKEKDFFKKASIAETVIANLINRHAITDVAIEESLQSFRPGFSSAKTLLALSKFNGIIQYICYKFGVKIHLYNVNTARKLAGIKINRKLDKSTKDQVLDHVMNSTSIDWPTKVLKSGPNKGKTVYEKYCYDMADAYVIGRAYCVENMIQ